jgi:hypothetical protein
MDLQMKAWLDQEDARTAAVVRRSGWRIQYVLGEPEHHRCPIAYTIGLFGLGHPELVVLGMEPHTTAGVLNEVGGWIKEGRDLVPGELLTFEGWPHRITVEHIPNPAEILFAANRFYERPDELSVPAYQLTYDDLGGRFPWDPGYANADWIQPRPGRYRA